MILAVKAKPTHGDGPHRVFCRNEGKWQGQHSRGGMGTWVAILAPQHRITDGTAELRSQCRSTPCNHRRLESWLFGLASRKGESAHCMVFTMFPRDSRLSYCGVKHS